MVNAFDSRFAGSDKPFVIDRRQTERPTSYREFEDAVSEQAQTLEAQLRAAGVHGPVSIALRMEPTLPVLVVLFAIVRSNNSAVLIHSSKAQTRAEQRLLERTRAVLYDPTKQCFVTAPIAQSAPSDSPVLLVSSSGSTGEPKIIVLGPEALAGAAALHAARFGWRDDDRWLVSLPFAHAGGLAVAIRAFMHCGTIVFPEQTRSDGTTLYRELEKSRATLVSLVPTQLVRLVQLGFHSPPALRAVLLGGAPASAELLARAAALGWPVFSSYGMTETCGQIVTRGMRSNEPRDAVGSALPGVQLRVDGDNILWVKSPSLFRRYLPPSRARLREGFFCTGDRAELDEDGHSLRILGRSDNVIITGGENVSPEYVEQALATLPGVRHVVVVGISDAHWGERVEAVLVPDDTLSAATLRARAAQLAKASLAPFQVPKAFHVLPSVPCSALGKPLRHAIRQLLEAKGCGD